MRGGKNKQPLGYTIVEVLIVLAISGMMFVVATVFIAGKQANTQFTTGTHQFAAEMQSIAEQVTDGQYSDIPFTCTPGATKLSFIVQATDNQGQNSNCEFIGKIVHFDGVGSGGYQILPIAGSRLDKNNSGNPATDFNSARATVIYDAGGGVDLTKQKVIPQGLTLKSIKVTESGGTHTDYSFGFTQGLGISDNSGSGSYKSGAQISQLSYADQSSLGAAAKTAVDSSKMGAASKVEICITDGPRNALITIDITNSQLNVITKMGATVC